MPELPEVETTRLGVIDHVKHKTVSDCVVRNPSLRWPIPDDLKDSIQGQCLLDIERRGKYLLFRFAHGTMLIHLGMSGSLRVMPQHSDVAKHDHVDICFDDICLRFNDPRRFGCVLWTSDAISEHALIAHLGPEPLQPAFDAEYLYARTRKRRQAIKTLIMDSRIVVGVGNIYANEALFNAGVHPLKAAHKVTKQQTYVLVDEIKNVLANAIKRGGTTLRDFVGGDGKPGYFAQELNVYGRAGQACKSCSKPLTEKYIAQRSTVYCTRCQH